MHIPSEPRLGLEIQKRLCLEFRVNALENHGPQPDKHSAPEPKLVRSGYGQVNTVDSQQIGQPMKKMAEVASTSPSGDAAQNKSAIYLALKSVPFGKVIAYGQLAAMAGLPGAARLAGKVLCGLPENTELPWHRVINSQGKISLPENSAGFAEQKRRLEAEGIEFKNNKINLRIYGYNA